MTDHQFNVLLQGYHDQQLSEEELRIFFEATSDSRFEALIGVKLHQELMQMKAGSVIDEVRASKIWNNIESAKINASVRDTQGEPKHMTSRRAHRIHFLKTAWFRYAAAIIVLLGFGAYLWNTKNKHIEPIIAKTDIAPGREGAILTLGDGTRLLLDTMGNQLVATQNGTQILLKDGSLAYNSTNADALTYNTMSTPRGRQFNIQLPDGSRAWLNTESSITYPTAFIGNERSVKISGEVYFEIKADENKPFKIELNNNSDIQVLGTSFNVKAYVDDANITTTLLEGSVRLNANQRSKTLKPGQQTRLTTDGNITLVNNADITKIMAWKNGLFNFQNESFEEMMKQLERWYDIDVRYAGNVPKQKFFGELQRNLTLSQVIEVLQEVGIQLRIEGKTLIVLP